ncbi:hypothetical protein GCM10010518_06780 [Kitasatospora cinereorecta]
MVLPLPFSYQVLTATAPNPWVLSWNRLIARREGHLREKTLYRMLHEADARSDEALGVNIEDLDRAGRRCKVKGARAKARRRGHTHNLIGRVADESRDGHGQGHEGLRSDPGVEPHEQSKQDCAGEPSAPRPPRASSTSRSVVTRLSPTATPAP